MAKIPFTLDAWLEDKSQKLETRDGRSARVICTDAKADDGACIIALITDDGGEEAYQFFPDGRAFSSKSAIEDCADLFIIIPDPELSEFEHAFGLAIVDAPEPEEKEEWYPYIKEKAAELLSLARDQFIKDGYVIEKRAFQDAVEKVDPEVMKGVSDKVDMEEDLRLEYERGKAEALKNLPRWREWGNGAAGNSDGHPIALVSGDGGIRFVSVLGITGEKYIMLDDLKKLPGFKED